MTLKQTKKNIFNTKILNVISDYQIYNSAFRIFYNWVSKWKTKMQNNKWLPIAQIRLRMREDWPEFTSHAQASSLLHRANSNDCNKTAWLCKPIQAFIRSTRFCRFCCVPTQIWDFCQGCMIYNLNGKQNKK